MIDQITIDRILDAANIVDVVSEYVTLRKRGVNYVGLCPFHSDKSPSFYVSPSKNICKCFSCGSGGSAVHFIMKHEQLSYFDALRYLAKKYNIEIKERELTDREKQLQGDRESMFIVNAWAQEYFSKQLYENEEGRTAGLRYFAERGFREDIIKKFQLGYSLRQHDALFQAATGKGYQKEYLERTGLIISYDSGTVNDRFRGRVMFPVHTLSGKVVAFGGRVLKKDEKTAKYVNSPESDIYHKSNELYGIYFAKQAIVKADKCFLVEGYTDVISMHQAGIENVVASSGTALTQGQIKRIHNFTNNITVLYDGDAAGIKAAIRGIDLLIAEGMNVKVLLLPDGEDPDSFARKHNATQFAEYIQGNETDFIRFKTSLLLKDANDPIKRASLITDIIRTIGLIPDAITRSLYVREGSSMMDIEEQVLLNEVNKIAMKRIEEIQKNPLPPPTDPFNESVIEEPPYTPPLPEEFEIDNQMPASSEIPMPTAPPPPEESIENKGVETISPLARQMANKISRSPFEKNEASLVYYIVRYGDRILFEFDNPDTNTTVQIHVAEYIQSELKKDELTFYTPLFKQILEESASKCTEEGFNASKYFLAHQNSNISQLAANILTDKYQLSSYHSRFQKIETEEERLDQCVIKDLYAFKEAYVQNEIKRIQYKIKESQGNGDLNTILDLMKQLTHLNELKSIISKELGERIILKM